ncbi:MAG: hypothetical protein ACLUNQ_02385 [Oscillospiraceae bacterium]
MAKGTASITANPDSSELPTITVKKGDKVISNQSGYSAEGADSADRQHDHPQSGAE